MAVKCLRIGENLNLGIVLRLLQKFESDTDLSQFENENWQITITCLLLGINPKGEEITKWEHPLQTRSRN